MFTCYRYLGKVSFPYGGRAEVIAVLIGVGDPLCHSSYVPFESMNLFGRSGFGFRLIAGIVHGFGVPPESVQYVALEPGYGS